VVLDEFVIMPNHVHGIVVIYERTSPAIVGANHYSPINDAPSSKNNAPEFIPIPSMSVRVAGGANHYSPLQNAPLSVSKHNPNGISFCGTSQTIGSMVRGFKIGVTKWFRSQSLNSNVWQRNYFDRIIRDEKALLNVRQCIRNNPIHWHLDRHKHLETEISEMED
jgi:REP element-mobilizing transposase RayT